VPHLIKTILALFALTIAWHWDVLNRPLPPLPSVIIPAPPVIREALIDAANEHRIDVVLLARLVKQESGFRPDAVSPVGAVGLTQLMPKTAVELGVTDRLDPRQSLHGGARYLRKMIDRFGNVADGLRAYNCGPKCVEEWKAGKRSLPEETINYVRAILA
jgi:soluble lytic murein transglycosylase-like protein